MRLGLCSKGKSFQEAVSRHSGAADEDLSFEAGGNNGVSRTVA